MSSRVINSQDLQTAGFSTLATEWGGDDFGITSVKSLTSGSNISSALNSVFRDSSITTLVIPDGNYDITNVLIDNEFTDTRVIASPNARFMWTGELSPIHISPGFEWIESVTSLQEVTSVIGGQDVTGTTTHHELTLSSSREVKAGDFVRIVSDDELSFSLQSGNPLRLCRRGEMAVVAEDTSGTTIKLTGLLRDVYTTNIRVGLYKKKKFSWEGGSFTVNEQSSLTTLNMHAFFRLAAMVSPRVKNIDITNSIIPAISFEGCISPRASSLRLNRMITNASKHWFGYGINDIGSEGGLYQDIHANYVRHAITTNERYTDPNGSDLWNFGRSWNLVGDNVHGVGCTNGVIDTHAACGSATFTNCSSRGSFAGPSSGGAAISVRGFNVRIVNFRAEGCRKGVIVNAYSKFELENANILGCYDTALDIDLYEAPDSFSKDHSIKNCEFETIKTLPRLLDSAELNTLFL